MAVYTHKDVQYLLEVVQYRAVIFSCLRTRIRGAAARHVLFRDRSSAVCAKHFRNNRFLAPLPLVVDLRGALHHLFSMPWITKHMMLCCTTFSDRSPPMQPFDCRLSLMDFSDTMRRVAQAVRRERPCWRLPSYRWGEISCFPSRRSVSRAIRSCYPCTEPSRRCQSA